MKKRSIALFLALAFIFLAAAAPSFAQTKKLKNIGLYTFVKNKGPVPTAEVMKKLFEKYSDDVKTGFDMAGNPELYEPFMEAVRTGEFIDTTLPVGEKLSWMLFRSHNKVKVVHDIEWAGKSDLPVFIVKFKKEWKIYSIVVPKPCGNIALYKVEEAIPPAVCSLVVVPEKANINDPITVDMSGTQNARSMTVEVFDAQGNKIASKELTPESPKWQTKFDKPGEYTFKGGAVNLEGLASDNACQSRTYINFPPICKLWTSCLPCEDYVGRPITFDASGSSDPDGEIVKTVFQLLDAQGNVIDTCVTTRKPWNWEKIVKKAGTYSIDVTVYDNDGAKSSVTDPCKLTFEVTQKRLFWTVDGNVDAVKGSYTIYPVLRGGIFYWLNPDKWSLTVSAGGGIPTKGDPWKFIFLADALVNGHFDEFFVGAGLGFRTKPYDVLYEMGNDEYSMREGEDTVDAVSRVGFRVFNNYKNMGHIFAELRAPLNASFKHNHTIGIGFRFMF